MKKSIYSIMVLMLFAFLFYASASSSKTTAPVTKKTFSFDYKPLTADSLGSAHMTLALVDPNYANDFTYGQSELFRRFRESMGKDIEEIVISNGFTLKGPYDSFDEMVYNDKKNVDLVIEIEIKPEFTGSEGRLIPLVPGVSDTKYRYSGKLSMVGKINLVGIEPLTEEKVWVKSLEIPPITDMTIATSYYYPKSTIEDEKQVVEDPAVYNVVGEALKSDYHAIMKEIETYLDPNEFNSLKNQIKELKKKKEY